MHTAPATSAASANVLSPVSIPSVQSFGKGTPSKFQDVYQNLPAVRDQDQSENQESTNSKSLPGKKRSSDDNTAAAATPTTAPLSSAVLPKALLASTASLALPTPASHALPSDVAATATEKSAQPSASPSSQPGSAPAAANLVASMLTAVAQLSPAPVAAQTANASSQIAAAGNIGVVPTEVPPVVAVPMPETEAVEKTQGSQPNPTPEDTVAATNASSEGPLPLSAGNLAFSLQLAKTAENPASAVPPAIGSTAVPAVAGAETKSPITPSILNAASSSGFPNIAATPSDSRNSASSDSTPRQPQNPAKADSTQRDSSNSEKPEASTRDQAATGSEEPATSGTLNVSQGTIRQALPASSSPSSPMTSGTAPVDAGPATSFSDQPAPGRPSVTVPMQEVQTMVADSPKTGPSSEILLHLDTGGTSAAVRVVDRAGTVNVSVHASDQDLRSSLRSNLSDLTTQLNAQGFKAEGLKTASSQGSSENRPDQGARDQRSPNQQPAAQGERQSPRERRNSGRWLEELQEQTSANLANSGGKNS
jgi:hypothetical protein